MLWREWERVLALKLPFRQEYEIITAAGNRKWVLELGQGIFDERGNVEALEGIIIDITEHKKGQAQIKYMGDHDLLTGLYNRKYFEEAKSRLDTEEYLPLSIVIADINGMRLINQPFIEGNKLSLKQNIIRLHRKVTLLPGWGAGLASCYLISGYDRGKPKENMIVKTKKSSRTYDIASIDTALKKSTDNLTKTQGEDYMLSIKLLNRKSSTTIFNSTGLMYERATKLKNTEDCRIVMMVK